MSDPEIEKTPQEVAAALAEGEVQLIDVREGYEWDAGHIAQARHIELERLPSEAESIDKERRVIFQCRVGSRSLMAAQAFKRAGFDAWSMSGGLVQWHEEGLPIEPRDGSVAGH